MLRSGSTPPTASTVAGPSTFRQAQGRQAQGIGSASATPLKGGVFEPSPANDPTVWVQTAVQTVNFAASDIASPGSNYINFNLSSSAGTLLGGIVAGDRFILALTRPPTPEPTATDACKYEPMRSADEDGWGYDLENRTSYEYSLTVSSRRLPDFANDMLDNSHIMLYAEFTTPPQG